MITQLRTQHHSTRPRDISALYTSVALHMQQGAGTPNYLVVPAQSSTTGTTITGWLRINGQGMANRYTEVLIASSVISQADLHPQSPGSWYLYVDGRRAFGGPFTYFFADTWVRWALVTPPGYEQRLAGPIRLNAVPPYGLADSDWAETRFYNRPLSAAELTAAFLPADYVALYSFQNYQPNDSEVLDAAGNWSPAQFYY